MLTAATTTVNAYNANEKLFFDHISFIKEISPKIGRGVRFSYTVRFYRLDEALLTYSLRFVIIFGNG